MTKIQALRENRAELARQFKGLLESTGDAPLSKEQKEKLDDWTDQIGRIDDTLSAMQRLAEMESDKQIADVTKLAPGQAAGRGNQLLQKWLRGGDKALTAEEWHEIRNTMSTTTAGEGGYTVQTDVAKSIADALKAYGGVREVADVIRTEGGNPLKFPASDGTSETGEMIAENTTATGADPSFTEVALNVYKFSSKIAAVPIELLQDSAVDIEAFVMNRLTTRLGRITNSYFTTGTGSSQPKGVVAAATEGKVGTTGQATSIIYDDLVDLVHSVDPAYRNLGRARFMMNDGSVKIIRKLKDDASRPIWVPGYEAGITQGVPDTLLGYPVSVNQAMAVMAANAKSILFGDFSFYKVRDVMNMTLFRFTDSAYAKLGQVGFLMWMRSGGTLVDVGGALRYYANSAS